MVTCLLLTTAIPACTDFEVAQFPLRMRDWLKNILMQLYEPNPKHGGHLNEKQRSKVSYPQPVAKVSLLRIPVGKGVVGALHGGGSLLCI